MAKRLLILVTILALAAPATAAAYRAARGDGTLSVKNGNVEKIVIVARGTVLGRLDSGTLILNDLIPDDGAAPVILGCDEGGAKPLSEGKTLCKGRNIRFRSIGGRFTLRILDARDVDLSAVGRGKVTLLATGSLFGSDGTYSLNGETPKPIPAGEAKTLELQAPTGD